MNFRSLRLRLLAAAGLAILLALAVAAFGLTLLFDRHIERREALSLEVRAAELLGGLRIDAQGRPQIDGYPTDSRFNQPAGGLYWQVSTSRGAVHSPSLWDQSLDRPAAAPTQSWAVRRTPGPYTHGLLLIERLVRPDPTGRAVLVQLAGDDDSLVQASREFRREVIGSLALLWAVLMLAAYAQVGLGLRPLARVREELDRLRRNPGARLDGTHLAEVRPLIDAINALADARATDLSRARTRASDLAHSLKTPLAAMAAQSRRAREAGATDAADGLDRAIGAARAALEGELARARAALARETAPLASTPALAAVERVLAVIERTEAGERIIFDVDIPDDLQLPVAGPDLSEILGALIENAVRHARSRVSIAARRHPSDVAVITIGDDGPGLSEAEANRALARGVRLDETGGGHGLGLSIVRDHVEATDGTLTLANREQGGLIATVSWPLPPA
ncbi:sensor histidine kinase [Sphingomonas sp.]|uniref:sensor histidine kinase n=1 Tax=Sphingomonas sp. TaxID=28214 RepID=UPI002DD676E4|nr:HAMP domain-containing sensor histidine kinase [Sphingomonas sp.]